MRYMAYALLIIGCGSVLGLWLAVLLTHII